MIITIDRQCGCGGHRVGVLLAEKLGLELYDKKKLLEESKKIGKQPVIFHRNELW